MVGVGGPLVDRSAATLAERSNGTGPAGDVWLWGLRLGGGGGGTELTRGGGGGGCPAANRVRPAGLVGADVPPVRAVSAHDLAQGGWGESREAPRSWLAVMVCGDENSSAEAGRCARCTLSGVTAHAGSCW